jgi:tripartite-type tricarboxylate transporter receptor subunit TctC
MNTTLNRRRLVHIAAASVLAATSPLLHAQADYPNKPITLMVAYPPGGSTDLVGRLIGGELSKRLGQTVIIENVGGAGGAIGAQRVANAAPDGYTLLLGASNEMAIVKLINPAVKYDPQKDFTPIGMVASQPLVLVAAPHTKVKNVEEFLALVKAKPGKYSYGTSGNGTALHLAGEMIKESSGAFMVHIPYRGVAPLTNDLLGGQLDFGMFVLSSGLPHIKSGKLNAIGTTEARRSQQTPDLAALSENPALRKVNIGSWFALFGPAKLPPAVTARLGKALTESLGSEDLRKKLADAGARIASVTSDPPEVLLNAYMKSENEKYTRVVDFAKIKAE